MGWEKVTLQLSCWRCQGQREHYCSHRRGYSLAFPWSLFFIPLLTCLIPTPSYLNEWMLHGYVTTTFISNRVGIVPAQSLMVSEKLYSLRIWERWTKTSRVSKGAIFSAFVLEILPCNSCSSSGTDYPPLHHFFEHTWGLSCYQWEKARCRELGAFHVDCMDWEFGPWDNDTFFFLMLAGDWHKYYYYYFFVIKIIMKIFHSFYM